MKILITAFEPFGNREYNASYEIVTLLTEQNDQVSLRKLFLPVDSQVAPQLLIENLISYEPDCVLCLGEAGGISWVQLEKVAVNWMDFQIPDNGGVTLIDQKVIDGAPLAYFSTLPLRAVEMRLEEAKIPVEISMSAGTYLCNQLFYHLMHFLAEHEIEIPAGFIHVPAEIVWNSQGSEGADNFEKFRSGIQIIFEFVAAQDVISESGG